MDSLCLQILELDALALVEHERSDGEAMDEQVSYIVWRQEFRISHSLNQS